MSGWIKIERDIMQHWIYQDEWKFHRWMDLLLLVNYQEAKVEISGKLFVCNKGETLRSLLTLSNRWKCSRSKVRRFLALLQKDKMIVTKDERVTTRISICNYERYQVSRNADETDVKHERTQTRSIKKEKKEILLEELKSFQDKHPKEVLNSFSLYWTEKTPKGKMRFETQTAFSVGRRLGTWIKNSNKYNTNDNDLEDYIKNKMNGQDKQN